MNGFVWVSKHVAESQQVGEEGFDALGVYSGVNDVSLRSVSLSVLGGNGV